MGVADESFVAATNGGIPIANERSSALPPPEDAASHKTIRGITEASEASTERISNRTASGTSQAASASSATKEERPPPLPPRPTNLSLLQGGQHAPGSPLRVSKRSARPALQSTATTVLSRTDIHTQSYQDGSRETTASNAQTTPISKTIGGFGSIRRFKGFGGSEAGDSASVKSYAPTLEASGDVESLLGGVFGGAQEGPAWNILSASVEAQDQLASSSYANDETTADFYREFDEIPQADPGGDNQGKVYISFV